MLERNFENIKLPEITWGSVDDLENLPRDLGVEEREEEDEMGIKLGALSFNYENLKGMIESEKSKLLVAKEGEDVVGFIVYTEKEDDTNFIEMMWVKKEYRSSGLASNILEVAMKSMEKSEISLNLRGGEDAEKFFGKHGFKKIEFSDEGYNKYTLDKKNDE